jgi:hypothetical protein
MDAGRMGEKATAEGQADRPEAGTAVAVAA